MKPIARSRAAAADTPEENLYQPELLAEEEPRYLRRQKPVEIRKRKFTPRSWAFYRRVLLVSAMVLAGGAVLFVTGRFFLFSPQVLLLKPDQIEVSGTHLVGREAIVSRFYADRGRSVLRIPLEERRRALEELPWVEQASVQRVLPNRVRVEITERTPIAFLRSGNELALIDAHGVILDRPAGQEFQFAVVSGVPDSLPRAERERRMQVYQEFLKDVDLVKAGSSELVSEVDLANPKDLRVVLTGLAGPGSDAQAVTVHFGQDNFVNKYRMLVENFAQWQANAGRVQSIDLQYTRQVVVNPETSSAAARPGAAKPKSR
jgi:cell division protein FtsQ